MEPRTPQRFCYCNNLRGKRVHRLYGAVKSLLKSATASNAAAGWTSQGLVVVLEEIKVQFNVKIKTSLLSRVCNKKQQQFDSLELKHTHLRGVTGSLQVT